MDQAQITDPFRPLFADLGGEDSYPKKRPLLAHYTSVSVLEAILGCAHETENKAR